MVFLRTGSFLRVQYFLNHAINPSMHAAKILPSHLHSKRKQHHAAIRDSETQSKVAEFYRGKDVFITGATGFLGKALLEKLLRSCPDIRNISCLVRGKNGHEPQTRMEQVLKDPIFQKVGSTNPSVFKKITVIGGDIRKDELGMRKKDQQILQDSVSVIFNGAATVKLIEPLRIAADIHVKGSLRVYDFAKDFKQGEVFIHQSSFGIGINTPFIKEELIPINITATQFLDIVDCSSDQELRKNCSSIIGRHNPYSYPFCKQILENEMAERSEKIGLPLSIIRPNWIEHTAKDPIPGWMDENASFLFTKVFMAAGTGRLRAIQADLNEGAEIIPVDVVVNASIASVWDCVHNARHDKHWPHIYNVTSNTINRCHFHVLQRSLNRVFYEHPSPKQLRSIPNQWIFKSKLAYELYRLKRMWIPAILEDLHSCATGQQPKAMNFARKTDSLANNSSKLFRTKLRGENENFLRLMDTLSTIDKKKFWIDIRQLNWNVYADNMFLGMKKFIMKEEVPDRKH